MLGRVVWSAGGVSFVFNNGRDSRIEGIMKNDLPIGYNNTKEFFELLGSECLFHLLMIDSGRELGSQVLHSISDSSNNQIGWLNCRGHAIDDWLLD